MLYVKLCIILMFSIYNRQYNIIFVEHLITHYSYSTYIPILGNCHCLWTIFSFPKKSFLKRKLFYIEKILLIECMWQTFSKIFKNNIQNESYLTESYICLFFLWKLNTLIINFSCIYWFIVLNRQYIIFIFFFFLIN